MAFFHLLRKGKKELAIRLKAECCSPESIHHPELDDILDYLLNPNSTCEMMSEEVLEWCRAFIAGEYDYHDFRDIVKSYNNSTVCGLVWNADYVAYRCRTCAMTPCMSLCSECFLASEHVGHDFNMFKSQAGGACDCGDDDVMDAKGFCTKHLKVNKTSKESPPRDLIAVAEVVVSEILVKLVFLLGHQQSDDENSTIFQEAKCFIAFLQELSDMGAVMQGVLCDAICDEALYHRSFKVSSSKYFYQEKYKLAMDSVSSVFRIAPNFPELSFLDEPLVHNTLLEELFFWTVKFHFAQELVTFVLSLLPVDLYKLKFTKVFVQHYRSAMYELCRAPEKPVVSNAIVHISVQLLSPLHSAVVSVSDLHLMHTMISCLNHILTMSLSPVEDSESVMVVDCTGSSSLKNHCYWPIVTDVVNVLSHAPIMQFFLTDMSLLSAWANIVSYFQGMNSNKRELQAHIEYEPESYYQAFSAELEICSTPLWTILMHFQDSTFNALTKNVIQVFQKSLSQWFSYALSKNLRLKRDAMSFHYPLHRYLALFISNAIQKQGLTSEELISSDDFLKFLLIHPLHLMVCYNEINSGMWVRNGQQIKGQAMFYTHWNFASSTMDPDYFLIQFIASRLDPDDVLSLILKKFHVVDALSFDPTLWSSAGYLESEHEMLMLESVLYFIVSLLSIRVLSGDAHDLISNELISLLCVADRTHSQLTSSIPDRCRSHNPDWINSIETALPLVSEFKPPVFEVGVVPQQGKYLPKPEVWTDMYDPTFVRMRALYKKDFQSSHNRYCDFIKQQQLSKDSPVLWPPFRLPKPIHPSLSGLYRLVHCSTMHALIFSLLFKAVNQKGVVESIVYLATHLLELTICLPNGQTAKKRETSDTFKDKMLHTWFKSNSIFDNALTPVPTVKCKLGKRFESEEEDNCVKRLLCLLKEDDKNDDLEQPRTPVPVNESIITLLLKLYTKVSKESYSYRAKSMAEEESRIGGAKFFLGKVLDKLCSASERCASEISKLCRTEVEPSSGVPDVQLDRRLKAKQRQQKLLTAFASKQKKFMEEIDDGFEEAASTSLESGDFSELSAPMYDCCICNLSGPSTSEKPMCMPARVSPTSILGLRRSVEIDWSISYSSHFREISESLKNDFDKPPLPAWFKTSQLQTCGHYMHFDCYQSYIASLHAHMEMLKGEFSCPVCRQISNTTLPLIDGCFPTTQFVPHDDLSEVEQIFNLLEVNLHEIPDADSSMNNSIYSTLEGLKRNSLYKPKDWFSFFSCLFRNNLELDLLTISSKKKFKLATVTKKSCIYPLYAVLSSLSKRFYPGYLTPLWSYMTRSQQTFVQTLDLDGKELIAEDICDVFVRYLLALPVNFNERLFFVLTRVLYNVHLVQLLVSMVCNFSPENIDRWKRKKKDDCNPTDAIISEIIEHLESTIVPDPHSPSMEVRTTANVQKHVRECLLPFLRSAFIVHHHVFCQSKNLSSDFAFLYSENSAEEFEELRKHLRLKNLDSVNDGLSCVQLPWDDVKSLVSKLSHDVKILSANARDFPATMNILRSKFFKWGPPSLTHLPEEFDNLFQAYRKEVCEGCQKTPKHPALCLACHKLICFDEDCCTKNNSQEIVWHSLECGNGTAVYLCIDSSMVMIVRAGRKADWGSVYLDKHGEEDKNLKRGKPLYLNTERYLLLNHMWVTHSLDQLCKQWTFI